MSLVTDDVLYRLWVEANQEHALKSKSVAFWSHLYTKYIFPEKCWIVCPESAASPQSPLRRVDLTVRYIGAASSRSEILNFHEQKRAICGVDEIQEVEAQAYEACISRMNDDPTLSHVFATTSFGTKARMWVLENRDEDYLQPLEGSMDVADRGAYIEAHSSDAAKLRNGFEIMRKSLTRSIQATSSIAKAPTAASTTLKAAGGTVPSSQKGKGEAIDQSMAKAPTSPQGQPRPVT